MYGLNVEPKQKAVDTGQKGIAQNRGRGWASLKTATSINMENS